MRLFHPAGQGQHDPLGLLRRRADPQAGDARAVLRADHARAHHAVIADGGDGAIDGGCLQGADGRLAFQGMGPFTNDVSGEGGGGLADF